jgi:hypothetical protein
METFLQEKKEKKGINKVMIGAAFFALLIIAGAVYLLSFQSTLEEQKQKILEGALVEDSPEFAKLSREIIFTTDSENTTEAYTGLGTIMMSVPATIRNNSDKMITLLQVNLSVVDQQNKVVKEKNVVVVPGLQVDVLPPNDSIKIVQTLDGFDPKADRAMVRWKVTAIKIQ